MTSTKLALFCLLLFCRQLSAQGDIRLFVNGDPLDKRSGEILLNPGTMNRVSVEAAPPDSSKLRVTVELRSATARSVTETKWLNQESPRVDVALGPLAAPQEYDFEAGAVYQKGYRLLVHVSSESGRTFFHQVFSQVHGLIAGKGQQGMGEVDPPAQRLRMMAGGPEREVYNPLYASLGPLSLRLAESVLVSQNDLEIQARLNEGETPSRMTAILLVTSGSRTLLNQKAELVRGTWFKVPVDCRQWPPGEYRVALQPYVEGRAWTDGPAVTYRRRPVDPLRLPISPFSAWSLRRDPARAEIRITDFRSAAKTFGGLAAESNKWRWTEASGGHVALSSDGDFRGAPLALRFPTTGTYAVFARFEGDLWSGAGSPGAGGYVQVGKQGIIRSVPPGAVGEDTFMEAADLTGDAVFIAPSRDPKAKLISLRLVPVSAESVGQYYDETRNPPLPMYTVNDWAEYFGVSWSRLLPDQFDSIVCAQTELGIKSIGWSVGRSWLEYHSRLPQEKTFPCVPYEEARRSPNYPNDSYDYGPRIVMINQYDALEAVYAGRGRCQGEIWPWLGMQRHYSEQFYGGMFACPFYRENPQWRRIAKDGKANGLSFFYPEVRKERVDVLMEVAERGADGLIVGTDRQPPMLLYEPELVKQFRDKTGIDPLKIDASSGAPYTEWIRFRANFFTETLRELQSRLAPLRQRTGKPIPVAIRIPSVGLFFNLAQGLDVEAWCREGLIQQLQLDPLEEFYAKGRHSVIAYLDLARRHGIRVIGGMGSTALLGRTLRVITAGLKRARGLHQAGVDGIDMYETEMLAIALPVHFLLPLFGNPEKLEQFLNESNVDAVYPVDAGNAAAGHDNHSVWRPGWGWEVTGYGGRSL
jgi:hypothetical protein